MNYQRTVATRIEFIHFFFFSLFKFEFTDFEKAEFKFKVILLAKSKFKFIDFWKSRFKFKFITDLWAGLKIQMRFKAAIKNHNAAIIWH